MPLFPLFPYLKRYILKYFGTKPYDFCILHVKYTHTYVCVYIYIHMCVYIYTYVCIYIHNIHMYIHNIHIYMYTHTHTHTYIYIYIHTHTYICKCNREGKLLKQWHTVTNCWIQVMVCGFITHLLFLGYVWSLFLILKAF